MIRQSLFLFLLISGFAMGMEKRTPQFTKEEQEQYELVQSYQIVKKIPHHGGFLYDVFHDSQHNRLFAGTRLGLLVVDGKEHQVEYFDPIGEVRKFAYDQDNEILYYIGGAKQKVYSRCMKDGKEGKAKHMQLGRNVSAIVYNATTKRLCVGRVNELIIEDPTNPDARQMWIVRPMNQYQEHKIEALSCDEVNNHIHVGLQGGYVQVWNPAKTDEHKEIHFGHIITSLALDKRTNVRWACTGTAVKQYEADLNNIQPIRYSSLLRSNSICIHDDVSNLLSVMAAPNSFYSKGNIHIFSPDNPSIKLKTPIEVEYPRSIVCDPLSTLYVGGDEALYVIKPKVPFFVTSRLNQQAFLIFSHL